MTDAMERILTEMLMMTVEPPDVRIDDMILNPYILTQDGEQSVGMIQIIRIVHEATEEEGFTLTRAMGRDEDGKTCRFPIWTTVNVWRQASLGYLPGDIVLLANRNAVVTEVFPTTGMVTIHLIGPGSSQALDVDLILQSGLFRAGQTFHVMGRVAMKVPANRLGRKVGNIGTERAKAIAKSHETGGASLDGYEVGMPETDDRRDLRVTAQSGLAHRLMNWNRNWDL